MNGTGVMLAVETSTPWSSVALLRDGIPVAEIGMHIEKDHSGPLVDRIMNMLAGSGIDRDKVLSVVISRGPGSFTGLRVGAGFAKGFIFGSDRVLHAVSSLEVLAANIPFSGLPVCAMLDARKGEVYAAVYRWEGRVMQTVREPVSASPETISSVISLPSYFMVISSSSP